MEQLGKLTMIHNDCTTWMQNIPDGSIDVVLTDPPYLYLKGHKLDVPFDEQKIFSEYNRVLKKGGFIVLFGRGTAFYRWNTILAELGFKFKEEITWDKGYSSSPLMPISRIHETISIHVKGKGKIRKCKIPYLEMKSNNIDGIIQDVKRMSAILNNPKSLEAVRMFIETNCVRFDNEHSDKHGISYTPGTFKDQDRAAHVMSCMQNGMTEKTVIRLDMEHTDKATNHSVTSKKYIKTGNRACNVMHAFEFGMNEKSIIKETAKHYSSIHPTQKPVRLLERLLQLVAEPFTDITVLDSFAGSMSTGIAASNLGFRSILIEKDAEYFHLGLEQIKKHISQHELF